MCRSRPRRRRRGARRAAAGWALCLGLAAVPARGDTVTASGSLGAGAFADQPSATLELGVDLAGERYAVGVGARLRYLAADGLRGEDWDEASEVARLVRYALYQRDEEAWGVAAAVGELGGARLGRGAIVDGYGTGLHADHGRVGAQLRARRGDAVGELLVDDLVAPRIAGARGGYAWSDAVETGLSVAADRIAPDGAGTTFLGVLAGDATLRGAGAGGRAQGELGGELVAVPGRGAGLHLGAGGAWHGDRWQLAIAVEGRLGTGGYVPGWIGPLYERDRREVTTDDGTAPGLVAASQMGGLGGISGAARGALTGEGIGALELGYAQRRGLGDVATARLALPHFHRAQGALWAAAEVDGARITASGLAAELRVRLPERLFVGAEVARLVREDGAGGLQPMWSLSAAIGAVLGEAP